MTDLAPPRPHDLILTDAVTIDAGDDAVNVFLDATHRVTLWLEDDRVMECPWMVDWATEDGPSIRDCGAVAVIFENGWACEAGHSHHTYGGPTHTEYVDADEIASALQGGHPLPPNARRMDGSPL